jgi:hypothetical protein
MIPSPMETDYWRTRTISEAQDQGYSHLRVTCSGCGRISDLPLAAPAPSSWHHSKYVPG